MNAARQRLRRFGRATGARTRSAAGYSITAALSVVPDAIVASIPPDSTLRCAGGNAVETSEKVVKNGRRIEVDALRFWANVMVVGIHLPLSVLLPLSGMERQFWLLVSQKFCPIAVPVLFMISGYCLFLENTWSRIERRLKRLMLPFFVWNVIFSSIAYLSWMMCPNFLSGSGKSPVDIFLRIFPVFAPPSDMPLWYLRSIFVYSLFYPLISWFFNRPVLSVLLLMIVCCFAIYSSISGLESAIRYSYPSYSVLCFIIGAYFARREVLKRRLMDWRMAICVCGIVALVMRVKGVPWPLLDVVSVGVMIPCVPFLVKSFEKVPKFIKENAFIVYAAHLLLFVCIGKIFEGCVCGGGATLGILASWAAAIVGIPLTIEAIKSLGFRKVNFVLAILNGEAR